MLDPIRRIISRHPRVAALGAIAILSVPPALILAWMAPFLGARYLAQSNQPQEFSYLTTTIGGGDIPVPLFEEENPTVSVSIPSHFPLTTTKPVDLYIEEVIELIGLMRGQDYQVMTFSPALSGPGLEISPSSQPQQKSGEQVIHWKWLIRAKEAGEYLLKLDFGGNLISERSIEERRRKLGGENNLEIYPDSILARVEVLTALGLSAKQNAWLKAGGALLGILGTIFGYPFVKRIFEKGASLPPAKGSDDESPASQKVDQEETGGQLRRKGPKKKRS